VMTVNVTQAVIDAVDLLRLGARAGGPTAAARGRLGRMLPAVAAFALGAIAGAFGVAAQSFGCLILPIAVLAGLIPLADPER
jgi:uncharacterized membrane protein YoaK (UPF0700 family)